MDEVIYKKMSGMSLQITASAQGHNLSWCQVISGPLLQKCCLRHRTANTDEHANIMTYKCPALWQCYCGAVSWVRSTCHEHCGMAHLQRTCFVRTEYLSGLLWEAIIQVVIKGTFHPHTRNSKEKRYIYICLALGSFCNGRNGGWSEVLQETYEVDVLALALRFT